MATTALPGSSAPKIALGAGVAALLGLMLIVAVLAAVLTTPQCGEDGGSAATQQARDDIPADYLRLYQAAGRRYDIDWAFLASIGAQECDHGRCPTVNEVNSSGCVGPMQLGVGGACGDFFARNKQDGNGDGKYDPRDPADAAFTAAYGLRKEKRAPPTGGSEAAYRQAACNYYGKCDYIVPYADQVMARAKAYGFQEGQATAPNAADDLVTADAGGGCAEAATGGIPGKVRIAPDANLPGQPIKPLTIGFLERMAGIAGREIVVTTGTRHSVFTISGTRSDHADGYAADIGMAANGGTDDGPVGDRIMTACLIAAGMPADQAATTARRGGLYTLTPPGLRAQCIWKTDAGGNHHNHVHAAAKPKG